MASNWVQPTQEKFVVQLQTPTGQQLPSIEYNGQRYFVGEPGQEFVVAVERSLHYPHRVYRVSVATSCVDSTSSQLHSNGLLKAVHVVLRRCPACCLLFVGITAG
jgi:hypothetical protein